tara:strand:+ start:15422 stop:16285 length:864 start_codon:yes stop_codon:yes gene_type:complete
MKIFVSGAGTMIGNNICKELINNNHRVVGGYHKTKPNTLKSKTLKFNLNNKIKFNFKFDCLVHCASAIPSYNLNSAEMIKTNYHGFKKILKEAKKCGCKKIILISSTSIYGEIKKKKLEESHKKNPKDGYGISKLMMEKYLIKFCKENNLVYKIYRLSNVVGKNSKHNFLSNVLQNIKHRRKVYFSNPNLKFNNLFHVDNLKKIVLKSVLDNQNEIYNLGTRRPIKLINIIKYIYRNFKENENFYVVKKNSNIGYNLLLSTKLKKKYKIYSTIETIKLFVKQNKYKI